MNSVQWLQKWNRSQCNNEWERQHRITIESLDHPGWLVKIDLNGTPLQSVPMKPLGLESHINRSGIEGRQDWLYCKVEDGFFIGMGGPFSLFSICDVFRNWVEKKIGR